VSSNIYHWYQPTAEFKQKAHREADESLRLQPDLGEGHLALGLYFYYEESQYDQALRELSIAAKSLPNDGDVVLYIAAVQRRQGRFSEAIATYEKAEVVDPRNSVTSSTPLRPTSPYATVKPLQKEWIAFSPSLPTLSTSKSSAAHRVPVEGKYTPIKTALENVPASLDPDGIVTFTRWDVALMDRDPDLAEKALVSSRLETFVSPNGVPLPKAYLQGCIDLMRNDSKRAQKEFESASRRSKKR
jgi:tetratricopeptide (TPR) repeat protein